MATHQEIARSIGARQLPATLHPRSVSMAHAMVQAIDDYGNAHRMNRSEVVRAAVEAYFAAQGWDPVHA